jgi:hypothetical protein
MKRNLLLTALAATMVVFASCEEEEPATPVSACVTCTSTMLGATTTQELCNEDGNAYINGTFVGNYQGWLDSLLEQGYTCR